MSFGSSSKTSDFIVDTLQQWWNNLTPSQQQQTQCIQIKVDNGSESSGIRTQFLKRMVELVARIGKPIHLLYYPPYHSKYNPIERSLFCWFGRSKIGEEVLEVKPGLWLSQDYQFQQ